MHTERQCWPFGFGGFRRLSGGGLTASIGYLPVEVVRFIGRVPGIERQEDLTEMEKNFPSGNIVSRDRQSQTLSACELFHHFEGCQLSMYVNVSMRSTDECGASWHKNLSLGFAINRTCQHSDKL